MAGGRPTNYEPRFCKMLIDHMAEGLSFESFAGVVGVTRATLYNWCDANSEFLDAKCIGSSKSMLLWEKINIAHATGKIKTGSANVIFTMKCRFNWKDTADDLTDLDLKLNYNL